MRYEGSPVNAPPLSRRRMMSPTPLQNTYSSFEEEQVHFEVEDQIWSARDRTVIARTKQYLEESKSMKVDILQSWKLCWAQMTLMWISGEPLKKQETKKGCAILETFSTHGPSAFLVVSRSRWDKHQRKWRYEGS